MNLYYFLASMLLNEIKDLRVNQYDTFLLSHIIKQKRNGWLTPLYKATDHTLFLNAVAAADLKRVRA